MRPGNRQIKVAATAFAAIGVLALLVALTLAALRPPADRAADEPPAAARQAAPQSADAQPLRYDVEYPAIGYSTAPPSDRVAEVERRLAAGDVRLEHRNGRGYLDSLLRALDIDPASQALVFSTTSLQVGNIRPATPRALYFNDDTYVAWVQGGGAIEIASMDPNLGPIFYTLEQSADAGFERETGRCLRCHDSLSLSGGGVPRFIVGSGYIGTRGNIVAHEGWVLTSRRTPLRSRWGGWYVTGRHGDQVHLGNIVVRDVADLQQLDRLRIGNLATLESLVDTSAYAAPGSDIVALMVMQHQVDVQNEISRVSFAIRGRGEDAGDVDIIEVVEPLVEAMLSVGDVELTDRIEGDPAFIEGFERRGPTDSRGRSLRELELGTRLLRYPLSYLVYSSAFEALPESAKTQVYRRFAQVLRGEDRSERFAHLSAADRAAILEILVDTDAAFAAAVGN
jgi:hypothetical protein